VLVYVTSFGANIACSTHVVPLRVNTYPVPTIGAIGLFTTAVVTFNVKSLLFSSKSTPNCGINAASERDVKVTDHLNWPRVPGPLRLTFISPVSSSCINITRRSLAVIDEEICDDLTTGYRSSFCMCIYVSVWEGVLVYVCALVLCVCVMRVCVSGSFVFTYSKC